MGSSKAVREAQARLAELEAQRAHLAAEVAEAEAHLVAPRAKLDAVRKRRARTSIISNTSGQIWFGSLADITMEAYGLRAAGKEAIKPKAIADAIAAGNIKLNGGRFGVQITLRGLAGRVRIPDAAHIRAHKLAVAASDRANKRAKDAMLAKDAALRACFDAAVKVPTDAILPGLVDEAIARLRLEALPEPHDLRHKLDQLENPDWDGSPLNVAKAHLAFAKSGSDEACPCRNCARERQEVIKLRELNESLDEKPTAMKPCPIEGHGRHRVSLVRGPLHLSPELVERLIVRSPAIEAFMPRNRYEYIDDVPYAWCRKGKRPISLILTEDWLAELQKDAKIAARKSKKEAA